MDLLVLFALVGFALALFLIVAAYSIVIIKEYERALKFKFGEFIEVLEPGLHVIIPYVHKVEKVDYRTRSFDVSPQKVLTKDNVSTSVNAIVFLRVRRGKEQIKQSVLEVDNYERVTVDYARTMLRDMISSRNLDTILQEREEMAKVMKERLDTKTDEYGVEIMDVEIKDVSIPDEMERAMAASAEAERDRKARIIDANGELQAAVRTRIASELLGTKGYRLRTLQTLDSVAVENATIVTIPTSLISEDMMASDEEEGLSKDLVNEIDLKSLLKTVNVEDLAKDIQ
ncbi:Membrane protease subunit stomatin/prohibitin -like protein [Methanonatronarchaeum thermophilum]|uniref:Membrane protease subunit stomatin/prohibitin-like protein n=1 Tax=Methanonatronarchaeum thermophilum TaxID=1927129 RepID=A0A1Y3G9D4_9EURY|nr:SPFH domain-containing protein [Methanonatronarchaeum thermophilum]OUJ18048.1 Membrane protease subunit stomatin/prohibitin -like protein [Methanonatronarchaeum thermophilum]